jgi:glycine cleavage system transcriptional repressor
MRKNIVLTLTGKDRVGIVEHITNLVFHHKGNVEASRMARLGGEFAMLMLISVPDNTYDPLNKAIQNLQKEGFTITHCQTETMKSEQDTQQIPYRIEVYGADHEGIIHEIVSHLVKYNGNIETMETNSTKAPMSGISLFMMDAIVMVPVKRNLNKLKEELAAISDHLNVDIHISPYTGK